MVFGGIFSKEQTNNKTLFNMLVRQADLAVQAAKLLREACEHTRLLEEHAKDIHSIEHGGDATKREVNEFLDTHSFMKIEQSDSHQLACDLENVLDAIDAAAQRMKWYRIADMRDDARELASIIVRMTVSLRIVLLSMSADPEADLERGRTAMGYIHNAEHDADVILETAITDLHEKEHDTKYIVEWERVVELLEEATDAVQHAADTIEGMMRKYA